MRVLVACEYSGRVATAFGKRGHEVWSADLLPTEGDRQHYRHHQGDALDVLHNPGRFFSGPIDLLIGHPPCTYLANSGARYLYEKGTEVRVPERWEAMAHGAAFFAELLNADVPRVCIENPVMVGHAKALGPGEPTQSVQPWMFGHPHVKRTCLWLRGLPKLVATNDVREQMLRETTYAQRATVHHASPGPDRWKLRSLTYQGLADAMADQWG